MFDPKLEDSKNRFLDFTYHLIDLSQIDIERLKLSLTLSFFLEILKHATSPFFAREFERILKKTDEIFSSKNHTEFLHKM